VIPLVLSMLRARRGQAVTLALLAMAAVAAAVAAPAYLRAVDREVVASEVAAATPTERGLSVSTTVDERTLAPGPSFVDVGAALIAMPRFVDVHARQYPVLGLESDPHRSSRLTFRQDVCAHVVMVSGRCVIGEGEVMVGASTARRLTVGAGNPVSLVFAKLSSDPRTPWFLPDGAVKTVTVVGTYQVPAPDDPYWGSHGYFAIDATGEPGEPLFTAAATMTEMDHGVTALSIDATPTPSTFDVDHLDSLRADLAAFNVRMVNLGQSVTASTSIPDLLNRIDNSRKLAHQTVPVAAAPLIVLAYFVIFLAAGYGVDGRQRELAVVALRGARKWVRWWLAIGETVVAIVAGAVAGCVVGQLLVAAIVAGHLPEGGLFSAESLRYAPLASLGAVLAAVLAQRRRFASAVLDLLRRIPARTGGWRLAVGEAAVALLAVVAAIQLWASHGSLLGIGTFAPALVMLAAALIGSHAFLPLASWYGRRSLRRGRLGAALAALHLARRPGARRLFLLLAGAVAILGFAGCAVDVAAQDRDIAARVGTGAPRVVSVANLTRAQLLRAVRAVDPRGRYAMAVSGIPPGAPGETPKLAVDSARLPAVAVWPADFGALSAAQVAERLRPTAAQPVLVAGQDVTLDLTVTGADLAAPRSLTVVLSSITGRGTVSVPFGVLRNGPYTYQQRAPECVDGCRLVGFHLTAENGGGVSVTLSLTLHALRTVNPDRSAVSPAEFASVPRWRVPAGGSLTQVPDGLRVDFDAPDGIPGGGWVQPVDAPYPLPVVSTASLPAGATITGLDGVATRVTEVGRVSAMPRLGTDGTLVDLEYADRVSTDAGLSQDPEVWLGPAAPADVLARLAGQGLVVISDVRVDAARRQLDEQGPALALRFYLLVGGLAIVLAAAGLILVAAVDRRTRAGDLAALRTQGVDRRTVRRTLLWGYPAMALGAGVVGLLTALVGWRVTGWALPVFSTAQPQLALPVWPRPLALVTPWLAAVAVLIGVALVIGYDLRRVVSRIHCGNTPPDTD
jgi:putative ABC transport system permease protein